LNMAIKAFKAKDSNFYHEDIDLVIESYGQQCCYPITFSDFVNEYEKYYNIEMTIVNPEALMSGVWS
jgi:hypothetical protein